YVDVSMIPLSAVERVEILTDGASAIYGSDAIGGGVNFILRRNYEGAESSLRLAESTHGDAQEYQVSQSYGAKWNRGGLLLSYEGQGREQVKSTNRDFSKGSTSLDGATLTPTDLLPDQRVQSGYLSINQGLTDR